MEHLAGGRVALRSLANGKYVTAENWGQAPLIARAEKPDWWETFKWVDYCPPTLNYCVVALQAEVNGKFVASKSGGASPLIASSDTIEGNNWREQTFLWKLESPAGRVVAFRPDDDMSNWVCAENAGASPLIANRGAVGRWEKFLVEDQPDAKVALRALANGQYVQAADAGRSPLIARRPVPPDLWERFYWIPLPSQLGNDRFQLIAEANSLDVRLIPEDGGPNGSRLIATYGPGITVFRAEIQW